MPGNLPHEIIETPGVDLGNRRQARLPPFGRPDVGGKDLDARKAGLDELMVAGDGLGRRTVGVDAVGGIICIGMAAPGRQVVVDALGQVAFRRHGCEIDHRRGAAPDGP